MQRNESERRREDRRKTEAQSQAQAHPQVDDDDVMDEPSATPSFLTAQELQAWDPEKREERRVAAERRQPRQGARRIVLDDSE